MNKLKLFRSIFELIFVFLIVFVFHGNLFANSVAIVSSSIELEKALGNSKVKEVRIESGTYEGNFILKRSNVIIRKANKDGNVLLIPKDEKLPILSIFGPTYKVKWYSFYLPYTILNEIENIEITGLKFLSNDQYGIGIFGNKIDGLKINNCRLEGMKIGIELLYSDNARIEYNIIDCKKGVIITQDKSFCAACAFLTIPIPEIQSIYFGNGKFVLFENIFKNNLTSISYDVAWEGSIEISNCVFSSDSDKNATDIHYGLLMNDSLVGGEVSWNNNLYETANFIPIYKKTREITPTMEDQYFSLLKTYIKNQESIAETERVLKMVLTKTENNSLGDMESLFSEMINSDSYFNSIILCKQYIQHFLTQIKSNPDFLNKNLDYFLVGIDYLTRPPVLNWKTHIDYEAKIKERNDILKTLISDNLIINDYLLSLAWYSYEVNACFENIRLNIILDGKKLVDQIQDIPDIRIDVFRTNIEIYKQYRENVSYGVNVLDEMLKYAQSQLSLTEIKKLHNFKNQIEVNRTLGDKCTRIMLFDEPLWIILFQTYNKLYKIRKNEDQVKQLGIEFASFGPIAYYAIVCDITKSGWDYTLNSFGEYLNNKEFGKFQKLAQTSPQWIKDTMSELIRESSFN